MRMELRVLVAIACGVACSNGNATSPPPVVVAPSEVDACVAADRHDDPKTAEICERAWLSTRAEDVATSGAHHALVFKHDAELMTWTGRALPTTAGARVFHFLGALQRRHDDFKAARVSLWRSLFLSRDRDPDRAANTALELLELAQSSEPPEVGIWLARLAWQQVQLGVHSKTRPYAEASLVDLLLGVGETGTAERIVLGMSSDTHAGLKLLEEGLIAQTRGKFGLAASRAKAALDLNDREVERLDGYLELAQARFDNHELSAARTAISQAIEIVKAKGSDSIDTASRLAAIKAAIELAEGHSDDALATLKPAIAAAPRDAGRVALFDSLGDVLAQRGDADGAEKAWREAADSIEDWRRSIPTTQLRSGLITHHRHALESWLESVASRNNVKGSIEVSQRILGRALLDRIRQREANESSVNASIDDVMTRLATTREIAASLPADKDLFQTTRNVNVLMAGTRSIWGIRRVRGTWSIDRIGNRRDVLELVDRFLAMPDDKAIAQQLGSALFPSSVLPRDGDPLIVMLDRGLADILLPGLRVDDRYLVEHAPIVEVLAPELLFERVHPAGGPPIVIGDSRGDLEAAASEAKSIAGTLNVESYLQTRATRTALLRGAHANVLHIATHATSEHGRAALVLADVELSADDVVTAKLAPRLAVIATCRAQSDDNPTGSLVAAFLAAGASGVVGSKRNLDDRSAASLMVAFYAAGGRDDPMRALAAAQREAIAANRPPSTWANMEFFGVGGWMDIPRRDR